MNLSLILTALLFYTKATETKECLSYVISEEREGFINLKAACVALNGKMASEDLKDSKNGKAAKQTIDEYRKLSIENQYSLIYLGISVKEPDQTPNRDTNPFVFSDGTNFDFDDKNFVYQFTAGEPSYYDDYKCAYVNSGELSENECSLTGKAICFIDCPNSGSERSRINFPLFALFVAGSVFNVFYALAGLDF